MKNRLRRREREAVKSKYAQGELLYKAMGKGARELEKRMGHFRFTVEELFMEVMSVIDNVKECPADAHELVDDWWNTLYCDFRDLDTAESPDEEIRLATSEVVYVAMLLLNMCQGVAYTRISATLMGQLTESHPEAFDELQKLFMPELWRIGEEKVRARMNAYMEGEEWISDDIADMLEGLPIEKNTALPAETKVTKEGAGLTNRQLIILFEHILNISLQSGLTNIKALSVLLSEISGRSAGSIRQSIIKGVDYEKEAVHADIDRLEALMRPISATLADQLKNSKEEN